MERSHLRVCITIAFILLLQFQLTVGKEHIRECNFTKDNSLRILIGKYEGYYDITETVTSQLKNIIDDFCTICTFWAATFYAINWMITWNNRQCPQSQQHQGKYIPFIPNIHN